jgi:hypothetical protein
MITSVACRLAVLATDVGGGERMSGRTGCSKAEGCAGARETGYREALLYVDQDFHCGHYRRVDIGPDQSLRRLFMPVTGRFDAFLPWVADVSQELTTPSS